MLKRMLIVLFFLSSFVVFAQLKIGIIGDQTYAPDLEYAYSVLKKGCEKVAAEKPNLVLHVGDIVESSDDDSEIENNFATATSYLNNIIVNGHKIPWYITAGDHDVNPKDDYTPGTQNFSKQNLFTDLLKKEYSSRKPPFNINNLYYSFDFQGYHFICLYAEDTLRTDPRWGNIFMDKIGDKQFQWLESDLAKSTNSRGVIVFLHQPMWYNQVGWERVQNLLKQYNTLAVIAGHYHYNQDEGTRDGIRYIVVGSTGGNTKNASANAGGVYHVTLMTISNDNGISLKLIPISDSYESEELTFTERDVMDRVQAIDTMIGSLPYDSVNKGSAIKANPIDLPIDVKGSNGPGGWSSYYQQVNPGTGISISNLSSVNLDSKVEHKASAQGMRVEFTKNGELYWDQVLYNTQKN